MSTPEPKSPALLEDLGRFKGMFQARDSEKDSSDSEGLALQKVSRKHQPPGGQFFIPRTSICPEKEQPKKCFSPRYDADTVGERDLRGEGQEPSRPHALPDDELHDGPALQGVEEKPSGTEADQEASAEDLQWRMGIVRGQCWTVRDYLKKQNWGKVKGMYRCAMMDAQAYEQYFAGSYRRLCATLPMHAALP